MSDGVQVKRQVKGQSKRLVIRLGYVAIALSLNGTGCFCLLLLLKNLLA